MGAIFALSSSPGAISRVEYTTPVAGTVDDGLYQSMRWGSSFSYLIDNLPAGDYLVTLYFTEPSWSNPGDRVFDIMIEGTLVVDDLDLVVVSGGMFVAHTIYLNTTVSDGQLEIEFVGAVRNALVSAISVVFSPAGPQVGDLEITSDDPDEGLVAMPLSGEGTSVAFRINAGYSAYTDADGNVFEHDQKYRAGEFGYVNGSRRTASLFVDWNHIARTAAHVIEFGVLGVLICRALDRPNALPFGRRCGLAFGLAVLYGITDELHQTFVPGRGGKWQDVLLDAASAGSFILVWWTWKRSRISDEESSLVKDTTIIVHPADPRVVVVQPPTATQPADEPAATTWPDVVP